MLVLPFDAALAGTTAQDFITALLLDRYGAAGVVTGADFVFGKGRGGDVVTLADHARRLGFFTEMVAPVDEGGETISSRSEARLVGKECVSTCSSRWPQSRQKKKPHLTLRSYIHHHTKSHSRRCFHYTL